ncbi:MAG TPA: TspO/MBR family protein [Gemmatimonadales bacterium]|nr:TspO/MBR family protein [Gemmatimonadales bacterium]
MTFRSSAALIVAVLVPLAVGMLGSFSTMDSVRTWYPTLVRPSFAPPAWVFGPVWTTLYVMMGVASWLVWCQGFARPEVRSALVLYGVQLVFNLVWSWLFFGLQRPFVALLEIVVLLVLIGVTTIRFAAVSRGAALLLLPYLAWVAFATVLNGGFWWLNRQGV